MKSSFQFYFKMLIVSAIFSSVVYAVGGQLIQKHGAIVSFGLLAVNLAAFSGMLKNMGSSEETKQSSVR